MKHICAILLIVVGTILEAQVAVKHQPPAGWFSEIHALVLKKAPSQADLLAMKPSAAPVDLDKILKQNDWINAGNLSLFREEHESVLPRHAASI
ncbi:MAG: hypothetical protein JNM27_14370 [Leptospirales bacterium]|nr:hypothetical protein [Leptospirales bacterium]